MEKKQEVLKENKLGSSYQQNRAEMKHLAYVWDIILRSSQLTLDALAYQSKKMDIQIDLLNLMAMAESRNDQIMAKLNNLINRAQKYAGSATIDCTFAPLVNKLATIPEAMTALIEDLKTHLAINSNSPWNKKAHCQSRQNHPMANP